MEQRIKDSRIISLPTKLSEMAEKNTFKADLTFQRSISRLPIKVTLDCGWIEIEDTASLDGIFGKKLVKKVTYLTTEDARNLINALEFFLAKDKEIKDSWGIK